MRIRAVFWAGIIGLVPGIAGAAPEARGIARSCQERLGQEQGAGTGAELVRRLYPRFDPRSLRLDDTPGNTLGDCDFVARTNPAAVAVLLVVPVAGAAPGGDAPAGEATLRDTHRVEVAVVYPEEGRIVRNPDALSQAALYDPGLRGPLPMDGPTTSGCST
jgi:hypothetical protein